MNTHIQEFGERLIKARKALRLSQSEFGDIGGVTKKTQSLYEKGERKPDADYLIRIAQHGVSVADLLASKPQKDLNSDSCEEAAEAALIAGYRQLTPNGKAMATAYIASLPVKENVNA